MRGAVQSASFTVLKGAVLAGLPSVSMHPFTVIFPVTPLPPLHLNTRGSDTGVWVRQVAGHLEEGVRGAAGRPMWPLLQPYLSSTKPLSVLLSVCCRCGWTASWPCTRAGCPSKNPPCPSPSSITRYVLNPRQEHPSRGGAPLSHIRARHHITLPSPSSPRVVAHALSM